MKYQEKQLPTALVVVAWLFIISGALALLQMLIRFLHNDINLNFGVLALFVGPGLLRLSRGWRTCGLVLLWIAFAMLGLVFVLGLFSPQAATVGMFGQPVSHVSSAWMALIAALLFVVAIWEYRVLVRPDIRNLFGLPPR